MLPTSVVLATVVAFSLGSDPGPGSLEARTQPQSIVGGRAVELGEFDAVVSFVVEEPGSPGGRFCTGTVIHPRLVLTAGHCLIDLPADATVQVQFGTSTNSPEAEASSVQIGVYPEICLDCSFERHDLGYILLAQNVELGDGFPIVITDQDDWDMTIGDGREVTMVGFGQTSSVDSNSLGIKRVVDTTMRPYGDAGVDFLAGSPGIDSCLGDSGGPALVRLEDDSWAIAGVLSGGLSDCGGGEGVYNVPLPAMAWIRDETGIDLLPASCSNGECVQMTFPDEGCGCAQGSTTPTWAWALSVVLLGFSRRRRRAPDHGRTDG